MASHGCKPVGIRPIDNEQKIDVLGYARELTFPARLQIPSASHGCKPVCVRPKDNESKIDVLGVARELTDLTKMQATNGSVGNTFRAIARIGSGASPPGNLRSRLAYSSRLARISASFSLYVKETIRLCNNSVIPYEKWSVNSSKIGE